MEQQYELLYREMIGDIERCMALDLPETERMENAFRIAEWYCRKLVEKVSLTEFQNEEQEISFFRDVKPQFACYMQYFAMLSEAQQFIPADREQQVKFWNDEGYRYIRFCKKHAMFINYFKSEERNYDRTYFLMKNSKAHAAVVGSPFDMDKKITTTHEAIARSYLAHRMYWDYCYQKLEQLKSDERKI